MKNYKIIIVLIVLCTQSVISQVGIGNTSPNATLDISSSNQATPNNTDGILIPKVDEFPTTNPTALQDGMLVYATGNGTPTKGFYYWDISGTSWINATGAKRINDLVDGKSDNDGSSLFLGVDAGLNDDASINFNVGVGYWSMVSNTSGEYNTAIGAASMYSNTIGSYNTANGVSSLYSNTSGNYNAATGIESMLNNTEGNANTAYGAQSLYTNTTGDYNSAIGAASLYSNITGSRNIGLGGFSLYSNISGNLNLALGGQSLENNETGYGNIAIGFQSGSQMPDLNNNITIGYQSGFNETASDRLYIENSNADANNALIYGEFDNNILGFNANLGIGTIAPVTRLHIVEEGIADTQTIVAGLASNTSNRPVLQFSETANMGLAEGMSIEYNGVGLAGENRMVINGLGGNPLIQFRNNGNLNVLNGSVGVQTEFPTCALEINHPTGSGIEGLKLSNQVDTDNWRFYVQWNTNTLALMYNNVNVGNFDDVSGVYTAISDKNQKTNISSVASVLEKIQTLQVVDYNFIFQKDSKKYVGLIAQDVEVVFPHLVNPPNEESPNYTMDYSGFGVLAIKAIQEQQAEIKELKQQLQWQQKEIDKIKSILEEVITD
ncbi:tail fiber domain-containing protein [Winogradskyella forsetii]|uniref:tail fiber domain-containing protein n=1 Tax=Winogradskyella forsetii TaxID=2686077 RepID=UPI0015BBF104|nr:tail fiber domain-containing protein [Winogradskyella forsetii]